MYFRECRMVSLYKIMNEACGGKLDIRDAFLMMGGMRNSIYYFEMNECKYIGTGGTAEINCPGVFDFMGIDYERIEINSFIKQFDERKIDLENYYYIIPVMPEMLDRNVEELNEVVTFGQSFFVMDHIEDNKIVFYYPSKRTWLDIEVVKQVSRNAKWVVEAEFEVYRIDKTALKNNQTIQAEWKKGIKKLLLENLREFGDYTVMKGDMGTIRIDGSQAYDHVLHHFQNMQSYFVKLDDKRKNQFCKYIYMQLLEFKKFILSGTDAYYRNEMNLILHDLYSEESNFQTLFDRWDELEQKWREHGRVLNRICTYKAVSTRTVECLNEIIDFWKKIGCYELKLVADTVDCISEIEAA